MNVLYIVLPFQLNVVMFDEINFLLILMSLYYFYKTILHIPL